MIWRKRKDSKSQISNLKNKQGVKKYILAIDQGTTGSRAFIFDLSGQVTGSAYQEFRQYFPKPGWVEHDAGEIWRTCVRVIQKAIAEARIDPKEIAGIGITNQRETTVLWHRKTSKPVHRAIVWQCRRTSGMCRDLKRHEPLIRQHTGLVLDPYFSGTKIKWLLRHVPGLEQKARAGKIAFGTIDSWLIWKLTGGQSHVTDLTNASRTLLLNIRTKKWDPNILKILGIPEKILPRLQRSGSVFGKTVKVAGLPAGIPITAVMGDQQAALYGQECFRPGTSKNTYGTGCFIMLNTGNRFVLSKEGLLTTLACDHRGRPVYALEGAVFIAGAVVQWLRDGLKVIHRSSETEKVIQGLKDTHGVYLVPAFVGLGAPYWASEARGLITGITRGTTMPHIVRAALESIAYQTKDVFDAMREGFGRNIRELKVDGGACRNDFLMQFQSDILGAEIIRPKVVELTAKGVADLAAVTLKLPRSSKAGRVGRVFHPSLSVKKRGELYAGWVKAVERAMLT